VPGAPQVDVARLPDDVAALIDALRPGEELVITRDGSPIATISNSGGALEGEIVIAEKPNEDTEQPRTRYDTVTVVAAAMKLSKRARASLSADLGTDYIVVDMNSAPTTTDVLLVPPVSPQLIGNLRSMFPTARIVVTEIEDDDVLRMRQPRTPPTQALARHRVRAATPAIHTGSPVRVHDSLPQALDGSTPSPSRRPARMGIRLLRPISLAIGDAVTQRHTDGTATVRVLRAASLRRRAVEAVVIYKASESDSP
jgi:antitoxin (DNA-binding transcriptional repressor) of toxin-antitoxin stability system